MQTATKPARTEYFFVRLPVVPGEVPCHLDAVLEYGNGELRGWFSDMTKEQLAEKHGCEVGLMTVQELNRLHDDAYRTEPEQITEEEWIEALEVLPPMKWGRALGVESFRMSEFYSGNITSIYARVGDSCWKFRDDAYMPIEEISRRIHKAMEACCDKA